MERNLHAARAGEVSQDVRRDESWASMSYTCHSGMKNKVPLVDPYTSRSVRDRRGGPSIPAIEVPTELPFEGASLDVSG